MNNLRHLNRMIKSIDTCNKIIELIEINGKYSVMIKSGEEIEKITDAPDLATAMDMFDKTEMIVYRNYN